MKTDYSILWALLGGTVALCLSNLWDSTSWFGKLLLILLLALATGSIWLLAWEFKSPQARRRKELISRVLEIPIALRSNAEKGVFLGKERELGIPVYLPDSIRNRHVHIVGATGSGKTESVILNFLRQDTDRGLGAIILDAKGDNSFIEFLQARVPAERLRVFDLGSESSLTFNPLFMGGRLESAQRLFASLNWSEEYYQSKAFSALQRIFERYSEVDKRNPTLAEIADALCSPDSFSDAVSSDSYPLKVAQADFQDLSGLKDQVTSLTSGPLKRILSPEGQGDVCLADVAKGTVLYFRLQSLISPKLVGMVGKLVVNNLNYLAGTAHRSGGEAKFIPTYLDEFASFACPEFADLISKARSAGLALHFSHQSIGDLADVQEGFLSRITDNSATKIVMRINDPDTAEFLSRSFGTRIYQKATQRVTNAKDLAAAEILGEGTIREAHKFRASPDELKQLPVGAGFVLIAHGVDAPTGASSVVNVQFPRLPKLNTRGGVET